VSARFLLKAAFYLPPSYQRREVTHQIPQPLGIDGHQIRTPFPSFPPSLPPFLPPSYQRREVTHQILQPLGIDGHQVRYLARALRLHLPFRRLGLSSCGGAAAAGRYRPFLRCFFLPLTLTRSDLECFLVHEADGSGLETHPSAEATVEVLVQADGGAHG